MEKLAGVGASPGIAIGVAHVLASRVEIHERHIAAEQVEAEVQRFECALHEADAQLARIQAQIAEREGDEQQYRILEAHRLMLSDVHLVERARRIIRDEKTAAEWAVRKSLDQIQAVFEKIEDPYFRDRKSEGGDVKIGNPFDISPLVLFAVAYSVIALLNGWLSSRVGSGATLLTSGISGLFDVDVAVLSATRIPAGPAANELASRAVLLALSMNALARAAIATFAGTKSFAAIYLTVTAAAALIGFAVWLLVT